MCRYNSVNVGESGCPVIHVDDVDGPKLGGRLKVGFPLVVVAREGRATAAYHVHVLTVNH